MTYSDDVINLVLYALKDGVSLKEVICRYRVSKRTVYRWCCAYMHEVNVNKVIKPIRRRSNRKFDIHASAIVTYVKANTGSTIYDLYNHAVHKKISLSTISRIAKANGIVHKRINNKTVAKDPELIEEDRKRFVSEIDYDMKDVIYSACADEVSMRASAV